MPKSQTNPALQYIRGLPADDNRVADRELLRLVAAGDETAVASLVRRHGPMVLGVCLRVLRHREDAEDAFQATFIALVRTAAALHPRESVGGWLHRVAYRLAQKARVAAARRRKHEENAADRPPADPLDELTVREATAALDEELARLPDKFRVPLVLCCLEGLTRDEAAGRLGWPESTLKSRLEQAREQLGARLSARGLTLPGALVAALITSGAAPAVVTPALVASTVGTATAFAAGANLPADSARIAALTEGVRTMSMAKFKLVTAALLGTAAFVVWVGAGLSSANPSGPESRAEGDGPKAGPPAAEKARLPGVDLAKIDRTLVKEPAHTSKTPRYCLLVFGPEAKTRVWLVHDGDILYVDRNGNGDLTEAGERVEATDGYVRLEGAAGKSEEHSDVLSIKAPFKAGTITERDGRTKHTLWVGYSKTETKRYRIWADVGGRYIQSTDLGFSFGDQPQDAPIVHLNGPLAVHTWPYRGAPSPLRRGDEAGSLAIRIGTAGVGTHSEAWLNPYKGVPENIYPVADIEFPNKEPGGRPIKVQLPITKRGLGNSLFFDDLSVPAGVGEGKARVTVHFSDWKGGRVNPATFDVAIEPRAKAVQP